MSEKQKKMTAVEACRLLSKSLKENLGLDKKLVTPKEAGLRVTKAVLNQIKKYEESLLELRNLEKAELQKDLMPGGKGDDMPDSKFKSKSLKEGSAVESKEHGLDAARAKEIAKDHLVENPNYYKKAELLGKTGEYSAAISRNQDNRYSRSGNHIHHQDAGDKATYLGTAPSAKHAQGIIDMHNKSNTPLEKFPSTGLKQIPSKLRKEELEKEESLEKKLDWHSNGKIDDETTEHEGDSHPYQIHERAMGSGKFHLKHIDSGHISSHPTLGAAKAAAEVHSKGLGKAEPLSKPPVSQAQRAAMGAAASGHSNIGIPKSVGKEFIEADPGGKLPAKKAEPAVTNVPPAPIQELGLKKNVFHYLKKDKGVMSPAAPLAMAELPSTMDAAERAELDAHPSAKADLKERRDGSKLPNDKMPDRQDAPGTDGSGGTIKKGKKLKKSESVIFNKSLNKALGASGHPITQDLPKLKKPGLHTVGGQLGPSGTVIHPNNSMATPSLPDTHISGGAKTKSMKPAPLGKMSLPRVGGAGAGKQMVSHALTDAAKQAKNMKMPAQQQSTKMPNPQEHAQRASELSSFMPKGKFDKSELIKEMEQMEKNVLCKACGKSHSMTKGC